MISDAVSNSSHSSKSDSMYQLIFEIGYTRCAFKETILQPGEKIIGVRARVMDNWPSKYFDFQLVIAKRISK